MVRNICHGGAAVNAIADTVGARVVVLDVGLGTELETYGMLRVEKVRRGTGDISCEMAMTCAEASAPPSCDAAT